MMRIKNRSILVLSMIAVLSVSVWAIAVNEESTKETVSVEHAAHASEAAVADHAEHAGQAVHSAEALAAAAKLKPQETCPIMGDKINKKLFVDVAGHRIYMCCKGCAAPIKADPKKAIVTLIKRGERPEVRLLVCPKCGEIKGGAKCCSKDAVRCASCGLIKGSIGCCKNLKPVKEGQDVVICEKCGEVKGPKLCCAKDAVKCAKCGLIKGSPGCCKIPSSFGQDACGAKDAVTCVKSGAVKGSASCCKVAAKGDLVASAKASGCACCGGDKK